MLTVNFENFQAFDNAIINLQMDATVPLEMQIIIAIDSSWDWRQP